MDLNILLNIPQFNALEAKQTRGELHIYGKLVETEKTCPDCGKETVKKHQAYQKRVRHLSVCNIPTYLRFEHLLLRCLSCSRLFMERVNFADPQRPYTLDYERHVYEMCRGQTIARTAEMEALSWKQAEGIFKKGGGDSGELAQEFWPGQFSSLVPG